MIDACNWDRPGADRYTGTVAAAIAAYGFPVAAQQALIDAFERREFDAVVIDCDSIRSKNHAYGHELRGMHFGSRGRICATVTRAGWSAEHVETALVFCAEGECIAYPAVCGNVSRVTRLAGTDRPEQPALVPGSVAPADELIADPQNHVEPSGVPVGLPAGDVASAGPAFTAGPVIWTHWPELPTQAWVPAPVAPIPEPSTFALLAAGLAALAWRVRKPKGEKA